MSTVRLAFCALGIWLLSGTATAQLDTLWTARILSAGGPYLYDAVELNDGSFLLAGVANPDAPSLDAYAARVSSAGAVQWTRSYGRSDSSEQISAVAQLPDGNILMVGNRNGRSVWLMCITPQGDSLWSRFYYGVPQTRGQDVTILADGTVAVAGIRLGATGHSEAWLLKCRPNGDTLWTRRYGSEDLSVAVRVHERDDYSLALSGHMIFNGSTQRDAWLMVTDANGTQMWSHTYGTTSQDFVNDGNPTENNHYFCGRTSDSYGYVACADYNGDSLWFRVVAYDEGWLNQQLRGLVIRQTGSVLAVGWAGPSSTSESIWVQTVSREGAPEWSWICPWFSQSRAYGVIPVRNSGYLIFGAALVESQRYGIVIRVPPPLGLQGFVRDRATQQPVPDVRVSAVGSSRSATSDDHGRYSLELAPGTYSIILSGPCVERDTVAGVEVRADSVTLQDFATGQPTMVCDRTSLNLLARNHLISTDSFYVQNDGTGVLGFVIESRTDAPRTPWLSVIPPAGHVAPQSSQVITVVVAADTTDDGAHDFYGALLIHSNGCPDTMILLPVVATVLDVGPGSASLPAVAILNPAYPNPFNGVTTLSFTLPQPSVVRMSVYNLSGEWVADLADGLFTAGQHHVLFDASHLSSGLYFCRWYAGGRSSRTKLCLLK